MTLGKPVVRDVARGGDAAASFRAVVEHIVVANRQPTAWEAGCLYAALCELAIGREKNAQRWTCRALLRGAQQELPFSIIPLPTAEELLQALALISLTNSTNPASGHSQSGRPIDGPPPGTRT